jgi:ABC-2 type transport system ATP-binding protein
MVNINNLFFRYGNKEWLFKDLNFELKPGRICGLLGKNGVGKTTLLRIVAGLVFPKEGYCNVLGFEPRQRFPELFQQIYFLPEEFYLPEYNAKKYCEIFAPFYPSFNHDLFSTIGREFELALDKKLCDFSYGQKKKFLLAFGIATECKILLLDEPTNGLDIPSKSQFRKIIAGNLTADKSFIISTHQVRDLESLIDTVVILDNGKILLQQPIEEISKRLCFVQEQQADTAALYQEKIFGGYQTIKENKTGIETTANLEALFIGVIANAERINSVFKQGK